VRAILVGRAPVARSPPVACDCVCLSEVEETALKKTETRKNNNKTVRVVDKSVWLSWPAAAC